MSLYGSGTLRLRIQREDLVVWRLPDLKKYLIVSHLFKITSDSDNIYNDVTTGGSLCEPGTCNDSVVKNLWGLVLVQLHKLLYSISYTHAWAKSMGEAYVAAHNGGANGEKKKKKKKPPYTLLCFVSFVVRRLVAFSI